MFDISWILFIIASLVLIITPGQDMILVMSRSISHGVKAGVATAAGVSTGLIIHTILAAFGLGAILRASEWLFFIFKLIGAGYLIYLGACLLLNKNKELLIQSSVKLSFFRLFLNGAISNISNPKIAIFFFAFLPQFVKPNAAYPTLSIFILGLIFAVLTFLIKGPVGFFSGTLSAWLRKSPGVLKWIYRTSGLIIVGLGIKLALERRT